MQLQVLNNASLLATMSAAIQGACAQLVDFTAGSVLRALVQANAAIALWMQWLILQVLKTTRAATSNGADLDSWVGDYGLVRLPPASASGTVTLQRSASTTALVVPIGGIVRTADGTQSYVIVADPARAAWNPAANAYQFAPGQAGIDVPVIASSAGTGGNVQPGTISLLASSMPGVDTVNNAGIIAGGLDAESDAALRVRASNYFASLSRATKTAVLAAVQSVQQGLTALVLESQTQPGLFQVIVDDGTGTPNAALLLSVYDAVDAVRPIGTMFNVQAPGLIKVNIVVSLTLANDADRAGIESQVFGAVITLVNNLPVGAPLPVTRVASVAYAASDQILNATVTLNGSNADLTPAATAVIRSNVVSVI